MELNQTTEMDFMINYQNLKLVGQLMVITGRALISLSEVFEEEDFSRLYLQQQDRKQLDDRY